MIVASNISANSEGYDPGNTLDHGSVVAPPVDLTESGSFRLPGYEILGELGRGGMGVVFKARQTELQRTVALKVLRYGRFANADELARFRVEADALAQLKHPNLLQVIESGSCELEPGLVTRFLALEYIDGGTLCNYLLAHRPTQREAAELVAILADAVHTAHLHGIIHRDLKPANVLLATVKGERNSATKPTDSPRGVGEIGLSAGALKLVVVPKIADFGLAKRIDSDQGVTQTGVVVGTPSYMAPEQAAGRSKEVTILADVYSLGAILYEAVTGRPPFVGDTPLATILQVTSDPPPSPRLFAPSIDADLEAIILKCLAKEPNERYAGAAALANDLRGWLQGDPISIRPPTPYSMLKVWVRQNIGSAGWAMGLGIAYGILASMIAWLVVVVPMLAERFRVYESFPSLPTPRICSALEPGPLWSTFFKGGMIAIFSTGGILAAYMVRPKNRGADILIGLTLGGVAAVTLFLSATGWFFCVQTSLKPQIDDLQLLARSTRLGKSATAADQAAVEHLLVKYPDLRNVPVEERAPLLMKKISADIGAGVPTGLWIGLIVAVWACVPPALMSSLAGGHILRHHHCPRRSIVPYLEAAVPVMLANYQLLSAIVIMPTIGNWSTMYFLFSLCFAILAAIAHVVVIQDGPWKLRIVLVLLWLPTWILLQLYLRSNVLTEEFSLTC